MRIAAYFCLAPLMLLSIQQPDMTKLRELYQKAALNKQDARLLNEWAATIDTGSLPVLVCYKGANYMIQAKYTINPINKYNKFTQGRDLMEAAIKKDTADLEMRFIRYAVQNNLPAFLGYDGHKENDRHFLLRNIREQKDDQLKQLIINYLSTLPTGNETKNIKG